MKIRLHSRHILLAVLPMALAIGIGIVVFKTGPSAAKRNELETQPRVFGDHRVALWWESIPAEVRAQSLETKTVSNIRPSDYVGPEACKTCHAKNYKAWSEHPHRWMNALADESTVKGEFSSKATISYLGGRAAFYRDGKEFRMQLVRGGIRRIYKVTQTIGSRFYQYYVGKLLDGPEPDEHRAYHVDHVLPFGYCLEEGQWVPTVHVHWVKWRGKSVDEEELPDGQ